MGFSGITAGIAVNTTISAAAATISTLLAAMIHNYLSLGVVVWDLIIAGACFLMLEAAHGLSSKS